MKKAILYSSLFLFCIIILVSCTKLNAYTPEELNDFMNNAEKALDEGNREAALENYEKILKSDPQNPKANLGAGLIYIVDSNLNFASMVNQIINDNLPEMVINKVLRKNKDPLLDLINTLDISKIQEDISIFTDKLEKAKNMINIAIENNADLTINLNKIDWNNDGFTDCASPLYFSQDFIGKDRRVWYSLFRPDYSNSGWVIENGFNFKKRALDLFFDSSVRGDAWFDKDSINYILNGEPVPNEYVPVFDAEDSITFDATSLNMLKAFINTELLILEPLLIYDLSPSQNTKDFIIEVMTSATPTDYATSTVDTNKNGIIENPEIINITGDKFLKFLDNTNGGANAINDWKIAINELADYLLEYLDKEYQDIVLFPGCPYPFLSGNTGQLINSVKHMTYDLNYSIPVVVDSQGQPYDIDRNGTAESIVPAEFFVNSLNFEDLKAFLPAFNYINKILDFPDPTFGGMISGVNSIIIF